jgi:hypothetical protein
VHEKVIRVDNQKLRDVSQYILDAMNQAQKDGYTIEDVITAVAFCTGVAVARLGGVLQLSAPLCDALPPLADGYKATRNEMNAD